MQFRAFGLTFFSEREFSSLFLSSAVVKLSSTSVYKLNFYPLPSSHLEGDVNAKLLLLTLTSSKNICLQKIFPIDTVRCGALMLEKIEKKHERPSDGSAISTKYGTYWQTTVIFIISGSNRLLFEYR